MQISPIRTGKVSDNSNSITELLDQSLAEIHDDGVMIVTSKIVSLCEGSYVHIGEVSGSDLVHAEADVYVNDKEQYLGFIFTIKHNTLLPFAGVDESNSNGKYVLWPRDPQKSANIIREYLAVKYPNLNLGVVISDSTCQPLRRGSHGIAIAHSGFKATRAYAGKSDVFGEEIGRVADANLASGIAAAAVLAMGEGDEQTPLCLITGLKNFEFQKHNPTDEEIKYLTIHRNDDLFRPFLNNVNWEKGGGGYQI